MLRKNVCEIDLSAIRHNVGVMRSAAPGAALMAVVKADAYGHGAVPVARAALEAGAERLAVAIPEEGARLRGAGIAAPILVLGAILGREAAEAVAALGLEQAVFDLARARELSDAALRVRREVGVHLAMDTGMGRIGLREPEAVRTLARQIDALPGLRLVGCFTHLSMADEDDPAYTLRQIRRFEALRAALVLEHPGPILVHAANSAALFRYPQLHHALVRGGIALYGCAPVPEAVGLRPAMRWVTEAVHVKTIEPGERVSYGGLFEAKRPTCVMTLPVGYADGYRRGISGRGSVLVRGRRAPILGRICMDQMMVDVTDIPGAALGDAVVLLGRQGSQEITAEEMAGWCETIPYEVFCDIGPRVPRVYIHEHPDEQGG